MKVINAKTSVVEDKPRLLVTENLQFKAGNRTFGFFQYEAKKYKLFRVGTTNRWNNTDFTYKQDVTDFVAQFIVEY